MILTKNSKDPCIMCGKIHSSIDVTVTILNTINYSAKGNVAHISTIIDIPRKDTYVQKSISRTP